ncbi:MAG: M1 family aminopeptidase [Bacteroidota bacterium]
MKKSLICFSFCLLAMVSFCQKNPNASLDGKCNRSASFSKHQNLELRQGGLMDKYDVKFYFLDIDMERTDTYVSGNATTVAVVTAAQLDTLQLELIASLSVDSVFVNGIQRPFLHNNDFILILLPAPVMSGTTVSMKVWYHGDPQVGGNFFSGISNDFSPSWGNQVTWTLSEPFNAYQWWPCKQSLTDKADSAWIFITTANTNKAGSEGILTGITNMGGSKSRYEWKTKYPIDYYLISGAVAQYVDYSIYAHPAGMTDSVLIQNYIYNNPATLAYFKHEIDTTARFLELYSELFGMYPFTNEKYGHCLAPMGGGMEHQTMTTQSSFSFYLTCHELSHQWFGDKVTCETWSDIWVNEGFASYAEYLAAQYMVSYSEAQSHMLDVHNNVMSQSGGSVYVPPAETGDENRIFDGRLTYDKGSAIIHTLRFELQDDSVFFDILKNYISQYGDSVATGLDFKGVVENTSGMNFDDFFNQWYFGEGYPIFDIFWTQSNDTVYMTSTQTTSSTTPLFKMLMQYRFTFAGGDTNIFVRQTTNIDDYKIPCKKHITGITVDPENWVLNGPGSVVMSTGDLAENAVAFNCFPNPCKDYMDVSFISNGLAKNIAVFDLAGRCVSQNTMVNGGRINTSGLASGVYFINVTEGYKTSRLKFTKL